ncbi:FecR family protein [Acetobacter sp. TBRC 12305]|uniref:FecR family protein n=1 Tax=Acetobacter garciniae TaxID=2817435 RepID=A0A939KQX9_9PROT|nr:FecR family protein [Acetobacter garciniae]MBO1324296.1 FecR family protein [Acetobacter garciniae]MBX0343985.1 FecR family protein [Acetobacter garciniae]
MSDTETYDRISLEAARWLVSLEENPDDQRLKDDFEAWLSADPAHQQAWEATSGVYDLMGPLFENEYPSRAPKEYQVSRARHPVRRALWAIPLGLAASIALFVSAPDWYYRLTADYATSAARQTTIRLADGSEVSLAPHSAIDVAYRPEGAREIRLLRGEGFFRVAHDTARPFRVLGGSITVTDIGTEFDIRLSATTSSVAVKAGRVHVDGARAFSMDMGAGQRLDVGNRADVLQGREDVENVGAWATSGQLVLQDATFSEAMDRIGPYYGGKIFVADRSLNGGKVTGVYNLSAPEAALKAMADTQGATLRHITPWIIVISR